MKVDRFRLGEAEAEEFAYTLLSAHNVNDQQARSVARNVVWSELVGRHNFGFERFPVYIKRLLAGGINPDCTPQLEQRGDVVALLDGDNGFGQYAGAVGMQAAIAMAGQKGVGVVAVRNSNFFGTGAWFVEQAAKNSMIGLALSNSFPKVAAHNGLAAVLGTNPFAFGAPRRNEESLLVDIATSALAGSTVRQYARSGQKLPVGLAIDGEGKPITEPGAVNAGALLPFAGAKGYCLAMLVEILAGVLSGAGVSSGVNSMYRDLGEAGGNGHFMLALDIKRFMPMADYFARMQALVSMIKQSGAREREILLPGEIRWRNYHANKAAGLALDEQVRRQLAALAHNVGVVAPWDTLGDIAGTDGATVPL